MPAADFGESSMASAAYNRGLTLAPFRQTYGERQEATLLADSFYEIFSSPQEAQPREEPEAIVPQVISLPSRARFEVAVGQWFEDTEFDSLPDEMRGHASFKAIVGDKMSVVPLIAAHLRRKPSFLFLALEEIFEEDPLDEAVYGNLQTTVSAWLKWLQR